MYFDYHLSAPKNQMYDITSQVRDAVNKSGVRSGIAVVYCPHTTAAITINENTDPAVCDDIMLGLDRAFPDCPEFLHCEGNSAAHLKASTMGFSATVIINNGGISFGSWQGIYFCEFDAPRTRKFYVKVLKG